ncbi:MAG: glutamate--cysteine ligase [Proteobacteria bacterium]|nr:MAG: glutamate--cysteine ligase [Pseudomonadota bacterium]
MYKLLHQRIRSVEANGAQHLLKNSLTGLEKESLRVGNDGRISQRPHPKQLGSALKNDWITTDYSEALLELITPPCDRAYKSLDFLQDIESFVYQKLDDELLWTSSMPCIVSGDKDIKIAEYGQSNSGRMKHVYRQGLAWRYGKMMQVIAGIHFNHSVAEEFWPVFQEIDQVKGKQIDFSNDRYMGMTRNIQRYGWLIPYLFGCSPAICRSFLGKNAPPPDTMKVYNENTYYEQWGTSLRMGDIGYTNRKSSKVGIKADYSSVKSYTDSLRKAIETPYKPYEEIGIEVAGEYRQLNANILQIENEYYSTVRPKQILQGFEKPIDALLRRGVRYVELRSVDINAFHPAGISHRQLFFLEVFMLFCLLQESPLIDDAERKEIDHNQSTVAHLGRKPGLELNRNGAPISLKNWGLELMDAMLPVAQLLDQIHSNTCYQTSLQQQRQLFDNPALTPSAKVLDSMMTEHDSYYGFARHQSQQHREYFLQRKLTKETWERFSNKAAESIAQQAALEAEPQIDFGKFLQQYFEGSL